MKRKVAVFIFQIAFLGKITNEARDLIQGAAVEQIFHCALNLSQNAAFLSGLQTFVNSAFAHLWFKKAFLHDFNVRLAEKIAPLLVTDVPCLEQDGRLARAQHFNKWVRDLILNREGGLCHYCSQPVAILSLSNQTYDIDHMVPIARGGTNDPTNLVLSCSKCNNKKRAKAQSVPDTFAWPERT